MSDPRRSFPGRCPILVGRGVQPCEMRKNCSAGSRESGHNAPLHSDEKPGRRERRGRAKREKHARKPRRYRVRGPSGGQNLCPMSGQASARKQYIYLVSCIRVSTGYRVLESLNDLILYDLYCHAEAPRSSRADESDRNGITSVV